MCDFDNSDELCEIFYENFKITPSSDPYCNAYFFPTQKFNELISQNRITIKFIDVCKKYVGDLNKVFRNYLKNHSLDDNFHKCITFYIANCITEVTREDIAKYFSDIHTMMLLEYNTNIHYYDKDDGLPQVVSAKFAHDYNIL